MQLDAACAWKFVVAAPAEPAPQAMPLPGCQNSLATACVPRQGLCCAAWLPESLNSLMNTRFTAAGTQLHMLDAFFLRLAKEQTERVRREGRSR